MRTDYSPMKGPNSFTSRWKTIMPGRAWSIPLLVRTACALRAHKRHRCSGQEGCFQGRFRPKRHSFTSETMTPLRPRGIRTDHGCGGGNNIFQLPVVVPKNK